MATKPQEKKTVTIQKGEYEALIQCVQVTKEYLRGKKQVFSSAKDLIKNLKSL